MMNTITQANEYTVARPQRSSDPVTIRFSDDTIDWRKAEIAEMLRVYIGGVNPCCEGRTPIAGRYAFEGSTLMFTPAFGFDSGQTYVARVRASDQDDELYPFTVSSETANIDAAVTAIYPSGDVLPENVLRFYVHFSVPMSPHVALDFIKLRDASGHADEAAFMRFKQELWNEDRTRLTVLIDPGRIKREVATNVELGPALLAGQQYTLSIDDGWRSANDMSALTPFSKTFTVSQALRQRPDVQMWQVTPPCIGTREPLRIKFDRPFDRHLISKDIRVLDGDGQAIQGTIQIGDGENSWSFTPIGPWTNEILQIFANPKLEDVAGNNFYDLLDHVKSAETSNVSSTSLPLKLKSCAE